MTTHPISKRVEMELNHPRTSPVDLQSTPLPLTVYLPKMRSRISARREYPSFPALNAIGGGPLLSIIVGDLHSRNWVRPRIVSFVSFLRINQIEHYQSKVEPLKCYFWLKGATLNHHPWNWRLQFLTLRRHPKRLLSFVLLIYIAEWPLRACVIEH